MRLNGKYYEIMIRITKFRCNSFEELSYLVWAGKACVVIDPGFDCEEEFDALEKSLKDNELKPSAILLTHAHPDHIYGVHRLCEKFGIPVYVNRGEEVTIGALHTLCFNTGHPDIEDFSQRIKWVEDGDRIFVADGAATILRGGDGNATAENSRNGGISEGETDDVVPGMHGGLEFMVLSTPGHTAGGVCYLCREFSTQDEATGHQDSKCAESGSHGGWKVLFSGDTLFAGCIGRSDLPGGDYTALMQSIFTKLLPLDGNIDVLPGHGPSTTIADERTKNPFLQPFNEPYEDE